MAASVGGLHPEPGYALSLPTWMVHVSSLIEWLAAMGLVWRYAAISGNPRWKGLTWSVNHAVDSNQLRVPYKSIDLALPVGG